MLVSRPWAPPGFNFKPDLSSTQGADPLQSGTQPPPSSLTIHEQIRRLGGDDLGGFFIPVLILMLALVLALAAYLLLA
jgi:hypothetical protein